MEKALTWLCPNSSSVLDFGCGNGKLLRCFFLGAQEGLGIDISPRAVWYAQKVASDHGLKKRGTFLCGDVSTLFTIRGPFQAGILSNIIDNLTPDHARQTLKGMHALLPPGGKLLLKLNQYMNPEPFRTDEFQGISPHFYRDNSGLFFWNLCNEEVEKITLPFFTVEKREEVEFMPSVWGRLFFLRKKC